MPCGDCLCTAPTNNSSIFSVLYSHVSRINVLSVHWWPSRCNACPVSRRHFPNVREMALAMTIVSLSESTGYMESSG